MGQIIKSLAFVGVSVHAATAAVFIHFDQTLHNVSPPKKQEVVCLGENMMTPSPILSQFSPCDAISMRMVLILQYGGLMTYSGGK